MPLYTTEALILRTYKLGEADRIVVFLTRDRGKKRGVANGARRAKSPFAGALEPLTRVGVAYFEREQRDLVRLSYAESQCSPLRASRPDALDHVGYFAELIDEWAQDGDPNERLFRLGTSTLEALAAGMPTASVARYFEVPGCCASRACTPRTSRVTGAAPRSTANPRGPASNRGRTCSPATAAAAWAAGPSRG